MGKTTPPILYRVNTERNSLVNFKNALRAEDQEAFDHLWALVGKHLLALKHCDHLLPFEGSMLAMVLEQQKEILRLERRLTKLEDQR